MFGSDPVYGKRVQLTDEMTSGAYPYGTQLPLKGSVGTVVGNQKVRNRIWLVRFDGWEVDFYVPKSSLRLLV